jgi:murein DD-endopeptidase MepM/ murein hydrolase activator NlpD
MRVIKAVAVLASGAGLFLAAPAIGHAFPHAWAPHSPNAAGRAAGPPKAPDPADPAAKTDPAKTDRAAKTPDGLPVISPPLPHVIHGHRIGWLWPLAVPTGAAHPTVVRGFEPPHQRWQPGHRGVDLLGTIGQEVRSAGAGTVSFAGTLFGRPVVAVDHTALGRDTLRTTYEPVEPVVRVGDQVKAGQPIGKLAASAADPRVGHCAPRACLHWGLVRGFGHAERYLDPRSLLERGTVRLLPVWGTH